MDYSKITQKTSLSTSAVLNISSVMHCATRLIEIEERRLINILSDVEGVKGLRTRMRYQIIFGSGTVNLVCDAVKKELGMADGEALKKAMLKKVTEQ